MNIEDYLEPNILYSFFGVDDNLFKIGNVVFEAIEDPGDGYRSYLKSIPRVHTEGIFHNQPLINIFFEGDGNDVVLKDESGHVWLRIGTDNAEDYYPCFVFKYTPRTDINEYSLLIDNLDPMDIHAEKFI